MLPPKFPYTFCSDPKLRCALLCCAELSWLCQHRTLACFTHWRRLLQAAQVRKSAFVPDWDAYNPDKHQSNTVYAGTNVQQVNLCQPHAFIFCGVSATSSACLIDFYVLQNVTCYSCTLNLICDIAPRLLLNNVCYTERH